MPLDEFRSRPERLQKITAEHVQEAAHRHFNPDKMHVVIVGDLEVIRPQLVDLRFGPVEVVDGDTGKVLERIPVPEPHRSFACKP